MAATPLQWQKLGPIFESRPDILEGIKKAADSPSRIALFNEIANHVHDQIHLPGEPAAKKRKFDAPPSTAGVNGTQHPAAASGNAHGEPVLLHVKEISVSVPQRKKLELCLTQSFLYARAPGTTAPIPQMTHAWQDIEHIFYVPVPDKAQVQFNYILFPKSTSLPPKGGPSPAIVEPLVFTVPATAPKDGTIGSSSSATLAAAASVSDTFKSLFHWALRRHLDAVGNTTDIVSANPAKFHSTVRQPQRPGEKAVHVSAFRGSKDGYLFFLETGILWGFKKPLLFIPLNRIAATSYTNILQITFNIVVDVFSPGGEPNEEFEFGMLDQKDYASIDDYVKRNGLQDRSMAERRKAKLQLAENKPPRKDDADGGEPSHDAPAPGDHKKTELEKAHLEAQRQMQDAEDEEEEDYDPGSDGDSDGSGESSEDDEAEGDADEDEDEDAQDQDADEEHPDGEEEEEEEEEEEDDAEPPQPLSQAPQPTTSQVPVRHGWAALRNPRPSGDAHMDEKFHLV